MIRAYLFVYLPRGQSKFLKDGSGSCTGLGGSLTWFGTVWIGKFIFHIQLGWVYVV